MTRTLTVAEAQADLPRLIDAARNGDEIIITGSDRPAVCLRPFVAARIAQQQPSHEVDNRTWEEKITSLKEVGKRAWKIIPTIDEIIEARDEGRR